MPDRTPHPDMALLLSSATAFKAALSPIRPTSSAWHRAHHVIDAAEPMFRAAIALGPVEPSSIAAEDRQALSVLLEDAFRTHGPFSRAAPDLFSYAGLEMGYWYGGASWNTCCLAASGIECLRRLLPDLAEDLESEGLIEEMTRWQFELFEELEVPPDVPRTHWWWFAGGPP